MLQLHLGTHDLKPTRRGCLFIHDTVPDFLLSSVFDPTKHSLDVLKGMTPRRARDLADVLFSLTPEGENTLTARRARSSLMHALAKAEDFERMTFEGEGAEYAKMLVDDMLFIPELASVLCGRKPVFSLVPDKRIIAHLDRKKLGDFTCLAIGLVLMNMYKGQVIVPDFGFYARPSHTSLIRENRLIAGLRYLDEVPLPMKRTLLTIPDIRTRNVLYEDALLLAKFKGLRPDPLREDNDYDAFISLAMAS